MVDFGINGIFNKGQSQPKRVHISPDDVIYDAEIISQSDNRPSFKDTFNKLNDESYDWVSFDADPSSNKSVTVETSETVLARAKVAQQMIKGNIFPHAPLKGDRFGGRHSGIGSIQDNSKQVPPAPMQLGVA